MIGLYVPNISIIWLTTPMHTLDEPILLQKPLSLMI